MQSEVEVEVVKPFRESRQATTRGSFLQRAHYTTFTRKVQPDESFLYAGEGARQCQLIEKWQMKQCVSQLLSRAGVNGKNDRCISFEQERKQRDTSSLKIPFRLTETCPSPTIDPRKPDLSLEEDEESVGMTLEVRPEPPSTGG